MSLDSSNGSTDYDKASIFHRVLHSVFTQSEFQIPPLEDLPVPTPTFPSLNKIQDDFDALSSLYPSKAMRIDRIYVQ